MQISDDLEHWNALGRVESVRLHVRITDIKASPNEVRIELNGQLLPDSILRLNDISYRLYKMGAVGPYGYIYEYHLTPEYFPKPGHNTVKITLAKGDSNIDARLSVYDVDCVIRYRLHRHFERKPIDY